MKTIVINLPNRSDRLRSFNANNPNLEYELFNAVEGHKIDYHKLREQGFDVNHDWIDPILNTHSQKVRSVAFCRIGTFGISVLKRMNPLLY